MKVMMMMMSLAMNRAKRTRGGKQEITERIREREREREREKSENCDDGSGL
jgi:hypothetical protein